MRPGELPLDLYRGDTYQWRLILWQDEARTVPADLTGATAAAEIRDKPGGTLLATMVCVVEQPQFINMTLPASEWEDWCKTRSAVWDLEITMPGDVVLTVLRGQVTITLDVTEPVPELVP